MMPDLLSLNETKLDSLVSSSFYTNVNYDLIRLDRNNRGGGTAIFLRKSYKYIIEPSNEQIEAVHLKIKNKLNKSNQFSIIVAYKPPIQNNSIFLNTLETIIQQIDPELPIFITGDFNMDLNSNKGKDLLDFMYINHFKNYIKDFTRISTKWCPYKNEYITSKTLIDVLLHNKDLISNTDSIECPFSDHNFILSSLQIEN